MRGACACMCVRYRLYVRALVGVRVCALVGSGARASAPTCVRG